MSGSCVKIVLACEKGREKVSTKPGARKIFNRPAVEAVDKTGEFSQPSGRFSTVFNQALNIQFLPKLADISAYRPVIGRFLLDFFYGVDGSGVVFAA